MIVERTDSEILVRIPLGTPLVDFQSILDFLRYKEILATSQADENAINQLVKSVKIDIGKSFSKRSND